MEVNEAIPDYLKSLDEYAGSGAGGAGCGVIHSDDTALRAVREAQSGDAAGSAATMAKGAPFLNKLRQSEPLLQEAAGLVDGLLPSLRALHDVRLWRDLIQQAQKDAAGLAPPAGGRSAGGARSRCPRFARAHNAASRGWSATIPGEAFRATRRVKSTFGSRRSPAPCHPPQGRGI